MSDGNGEPAAVLLQRARGGDHAAITVLIERNLEWLREQVRRRLHGGLRRELESADLVQDVVASLLGAASGAVVRDEEHFRALLLRVVDADVHDRLRWQGRARRDRRREAALPADSSTPGFRPFDSVTRPSQHADRAERLAWVRVALLRLPPDDQLLLQRRIWQQMPFAQIAAECAISEDAARMRTNRALARLAQAVAALRS
jgi:RNA polymerase sigma factor (sigma-70 family)